MPMADLSQPTTPPPPPPLPQPYYSDIVLYPTQHWPTNTSGYPVGPSISQGSVPNWQAQVPHFVQGSEQRTHFERHLTSPPAHWNIPIPASMGPLQLEQEYASATEANPLPSPICPSTSLAFPDKQAASTHCTVLALSSQARYQAQVGQKAVF